MTFLSNSSVFFLIWDQPPYFQKEVFWKESAADKTLMHSSLKGWKTTGWRKVFRVTKEKVQRFRRI